MARPVHNKKVKVIPKTVAWILVLAVSATAILFSVYLMSESQKSVSNAMYPLDYKEYVEKASKDYNLKEELIFGIIKTESNFDPDAESYVGANGLMQIMPDSFDWLQTIRGVDGKYTESDLFTPEINIDYGCYLLRYFLDLYGTEQTAIAAYNAGFVVGEWLENPDYSSDGVTLDNIPYPETDAYVDKVLSAKAKYKELYFS